jgi:hypothetical protein
MRKIKFTLLLIILSIYTSAQSLESIGFRFGGGLYGSAAEINARFNNDGIFEKINDKFYNFNRVESSLAWSANQFRSNFFASSVFQIVKPLENNFSYYYGVGISLGVQSWNGNQSINGKKSNGFSFGVPVQLGIEYGFDELPLNISLDIRPMPTVSTNSILGLPSIPVSLGLGLRYTI